MNQKRVLSVLLLSIILASILFSASVIAPDQVTAEAQQAGKDAATVAGQTVNKATEGAKTLGQQVVDWILSSDKISDDTRGAISKLLLTGLVILLVFTISSVVPFLDDATDTIKWSVSIIIGLLSFMFVKVENITYILTNFEALGVALTTIIPLIIIVSFTVKLNEKNPQIARIINPIFLIVFAVYLGIKWGMITFGYYQIKQIPELGYAYPITLVLVLIWFMWGERKFTKWYREEVININVNAADKVIRESAALQEMGAKSLEAMAKSAKKTKNPIIDPATGKPFLPS